MTNFDTLPPLKAQAITLDFFMGQVRLALVAVLAYGGGAHWFTPEQAGLYMALFTSLGPVGIPWAWSVISNLGTIRISSKSAAAVVAKVETVDTDSASKAANTAVIANIKNPNVPTVSAILLALALSLFALPDDASAQVKLTGNIRNDLAQVVPAVAAPPRASGIDGALQNFGDGVRKIEKAAVDKGIADLNAAIKDAQDHNDQISLPCWQANLKLLQTLPTQWETPPEFPIGVALGIQIQRDLLNAITGSDIGSIKVACAALWGDQLKIVANVGALIGIRAATGGLF